MRKEGVARRGWAEGEASLPRWLFLLSSSESFTSVEKQSFECLVLSEIGDRNTQGVDGDKLVWDFALKNKHEIRRVKVAFYLAMVSGRVINKVEIDSGLERRSLHVL